MIERSPLRSVLNTPKGDFLVINNIMKVINEAVDEIRRQEVKENEHLKNTKYLWLKNPSN